MENLYNDPIGKSAWISMDSQIQNYSYCGVRSQLRDEIYLGGFMYHNEDNKSLYDNQYGGRRGRQPQSAILNKILSLETIRHYGEDAALVDNDAKACYDRIIPYLTTYMLRRLGMPYFLSKFMCTVLKQMHYSIRLPLGQSTTYDSSDNTLFGTGQGAGWSPPCWAANSDIVSCCMETYIPGILLVHPNNKIVSNRHLDVFVDDTQPRCNEGSNEKT